MDLKLLILLLEMKKECFKNLLMHYLITVEEEGLLQEQEKDLLKSLAEMLKGKQGRFRQNLLRQKS